MKEGIGVNLVRTKFKVLSKLSKKKAAEQAFDLFVTPQSRVRKAPSVIIQKAEQLTLTFEGLKTFGYRWNHKQGEKKVLILHGHESSAVNFDHYVLPLAKNGFEVVAFDAPAHGKSEGKKINAWDYKNFIIEVIKAYGPFTNFISHSFGGLALSLALEEIPHDESWKAVLIAPATESTTAINNFFRFLKLDDEVRKEFDDLITAANKRPASWYSVSRAAEHIKAQVLFLQDKQDQLTPLSDIEPIIEKGYPNFRFVISEGLGHRNIYKDKRTLQVIIDFL
ncbi:MAG TPA: alpha/beta fold hydrolase [Flavisolibacter sp.]|nr:alpha/beta fold hydrolase [Flavisolibacter sp.]